MTPSTVIVPNPNVAQRQDRSAKPDARGAYPADEAYVWYTRGADGKKASTMPDYASMEPGDLGAIVAYLATLGREERPGGEEAMKTIVVLLLAAALALPQRWPHRPARRSR